MTSRIVPSGSDILDPRGLSTAVGSLAGSWKMDRRLICLVTVVLALSTRVLSIRSGSNLFNFGFETDEPTTSPPRRLQWQNTDNLQCSPGKLHFHSIPRGQTRVDSIHSLGSLTNQECERECCRLGPALCQYAWVFERKCFAVACPDNPENCEPKGLTGIDTTYLHMLWHRADETSGLSSQNDTMATTNSTAPTSTTTTSTMDTTTAPSTRPPITQAPTTVSSTHAPITQAPTTASSTRAPITQAPTTVSLATHPPTTASEPSVTHQPSQKTIRVAATGDTEITLPENSAQIFASTWPEPKYSWDFTYSWVKVFGPEEGTISGENNKNIKLTGLVAGVYGLRLTVQSVQGSWGETNVNVTVHAKPRVNSPPTVIISPTNDVQLVLPHDTTILDASSSTDDGGSKALIFHWEEVQGPIRNSALVSDTAMLRLHDLKQGKYRYKLTVTDADGAHSIAYANVTVHPEKDYPPVANAEGPLLIYLPKDEVYLSGNKSTDDKGVLQYRWQQLKGHPVDMEGSQTSILHVTKLTVGVYEFELTVTDSAGHSDVSTVTVDVKPEKTTPPVVNAGRNHTVVFPDDSVTLDGSKSNNDDNSISSYVWTQVSGPMDIQLSGKTTPYLTLHGLHIDQNYGSPTLYRFKLTITNHRNLSSSDTVTVFYSKDPKVPPRAIAGPNVTIHLPETTAILNGSQSHDDFGIVDYHWERSSDSPAAGMAIHHSDKLPVLILSNLANGTYHFTLTITNQNKEKASDNVTLTVLPNPHERHIIQVHVEEDPWNFTQDDLRDLANSLTLMLNTHGATHSIKFQGVYPTDPYVVVEFYAINERTKEPLNATHAYEMLTTKGQDYYFARFHIIRVEMKVCQLLCSGHGMCNVRTKKCECNTFWMENPFKARLGKKESNCDWSVFYVVLVAMGSTLLLLFVIWLCCCCCLRRRRMVRTKRRVRYAILEHKDEESTRMLPKDSSGYQQSSLMVSESDTEEEILLDSTKKTQPAPSPVPTIKNNKLSGGDKYGKNSAQANSSTPK